MLLSRRCKEGKYELVALYCQTAVGGAETRLFEGIIGPPQRSWEQAQQAARQIMAQPLGLTKPLRIRIRPVPASTR